MSKLHLQPDFDAFCALAAKGNLVPVMAELAADYETPLSAFQKIHDGRSAFLLESAELTQHSGRYSLLGSSPRLIFTARGKEIEVEERGKVRRFTTTTDPLEELRQIMLPYKPAEVTHIPVFHGGAVGYLAYDMVRFFEPTLPAPPKDELGLPDMVFMVTDSVLIFDHRTRRLMLVANVHTDEHATLEAAYDWAKTEIERLITKLSQPLAVKPLQTFAPVKNDQLPPPVSNTTRAEYEGMVTKMKEYIGAGDIFQGVPSQRFETDYTGTTVDLFRALRHVNPSPYMFCMDLPGGFSLVGSSPEVHVKCLDGKIEIRPIAGTRWRGKTKIEDDALAAELLADPKERAEHIMLVDLARNDVGRVAEYGTVKVTDLMIIERYSHVMHIVSNVEGRLHADKNAYDVMRATFPAGTVSGSPKVRAMEIINEVEKSKRCAYAGAVGYYGFDGNLDSCIALRTCVVKDGKAYVQAGAGIVADSDPGAEFTETVNKATGMLRAIEWARNL
ncbi:anthranilate synthase component I [Brevifollis gellanilyticus]|uniref:Anthranilate synthase component 1 n=1 Tax=Brevifollis gellanilyticus TaxID=748831 RepID=A0A512MBV6_9BACT|nr:anthranilate synthase component I [Brevifollis gellanilyticus]GEP44222.1 anthranilate synthase component I [Brevifollis gellanilyticus]